MTILSACEFLVDLVTILSGVELLVDFFNVYTRGLHQQYYFGGFNTILSSVELLVGDELPVLV